MGEKSSIVDPLLEGAVDVTLADGSERTRRFAVNVDAAEGDLKKLGPRELAGRLEGVRYEFHEAADITYNPRQLAGLNLSTALLVALIAILVGEQLLAYACSYHPRAKEGRA